jgi:hypothetical protein
MPKTIALAVSFLAACGGSSPDPLVTLPDNTLFHVSVTKDRPVLSCDGTVHTGTNAAQFTCVNYLSGTQVVYSVQGVLEYTPLDDRAKLHVRALGSDADHYPASNGYPLAIALVHDGEQWSGWGSIYPRDAAFGYFDANVTAYTDRSK